MAVPKKKTSKSKTRSRRAERVAADTPPRSLCPRCGSAKLPHTVCGSCGWYKRPRRRRRRLNRRNASLTCSPSRSTPWAATTPGRDRRRGAPGRRAPACPSCSSGRPVSTASTAHRCPLDLIEASEVIGMHDDPAQGVRRKKDSTLVRAAEAVRDGRASAMISAGNTGATMASALLRMGRIKGVSRPAIATPIPVPGSTPTILLDAGANAEVQAGVARAVRPDGRGLRPPPLRHRRARGRPAVDRRGAGQGRHAAQGDLRAARVGARARTSSATSRAAT